MQGSQQDSDMENQHGKAICQLVVPLTSNYIADEINLIQTEAALEQPVLQAPKLHLHTLGFAGENPGESLFH